MSGEKEDIRCLRRWLRSQDPEEKAKRVLYNKSEKVKKRRSASSKKRRHSSSAILAIIKKGQLKADDGKCYTFKHGRIIEEGDKGQRFVIRATKKGIIHRLEFDKDDDLEDERYDIALKDGHNSFKDLAKKLLIDGDEDLTRTVSRQHITFEEEIPKEKLFWCHMSQGEKEQLLQKLNSDEE